MATMVTNSENYQVKYKVMDMNKSQYWNYDLMTWSANFVSLNIQNRWIHLHGHVLLLHVYTFTTPHYVDMCYFYMFIHLPPHITWPLLRGSFNTKVTSILFSDKTCEISNYQPDHFVSMKLVIMPAWSTHTSWNTRQLNGYHPNYNLLLSPKFQRIQNEKLKALDFCGKSE